MFVVAVLWTAFFLINFNVAMMIPLLPFIQRDIGLTSSEAGLVLAAFPVTALVFNLAFGPFIDRYGRKRFIIAGAIACACMFVLTAASRHALPIAAARAATGLFLPMVGASIFAAIADYIPPENQARAAGYVTTAAPVAFLVAMSIGVLLGGLVAWQLPVLLIAAVSLGLGLCAVFLPPTPVDALAHGRIIPKTYRRRLLSLSLDAGTRQLMLGYFAWATAVYVFMGLYPSWAVQHGLAAQSTGTIGVALLVGEVGGLFGALLAGPLARLFGHPMTLCALATLAAAAFVLAIPLGTGDLIFQAIGYALFAFTRDLTLALILGGAMALVTAAQRGSLNAILNAIYQTGGAVGGMASAWLYAANAGFFLNATTAGCLFGISALMLWTITRLNLQTP